MYGLAVYSRNVVSEKDQFGSWATGVQRHAGRQACKEKHRDRETDRESETDKQTKRQRKCDRLKDRQRDKHADRQTQAERQRDGETDRQRDRERHHYQSPCKANMEKKGILTGENIAITFPFIFCLTGVEQPKHLGKKIASCPFQF